MTRCRWQVAVLGLACGLLGPSTSSAQEPASAEPRRAEGVAKVVLQAVLYREGPAKVTLLATNADAVEQELPVTSDQVYEVFLFEPGPWRVRPAPGRGFWGRAILIDLDATTDGGITSVEGEAEVQPEVVPPCSKCRSIRR